MPIYNDNNEKIGNMSQASRKDLREAVRAARAAQPAWEKAAPYLKGQIIYRLAEMLEGRWAEFVQRMEEQGHPEAVQEVQGAIDALVHWAGWSDKYQALASSVNPVTGPFHNHTAPEPVGVVAVVTHKSLIDTLNLILSAFVGGNAVIAVGGPLLIEFAELCATSDVPAGTINLLTGDPTELVPELAKHQDIDALTISDTFSEMDLETEDVRKSAAKSLKRLPPPKEDPLAQIMAFQERKTVWHPAKS